MWSILFIPTNNPHAHERLALYVDSDRAYSLSERLEGRKPQLTDEIGTRKRAQLVIVSCEFLRVQSASHLFALVWWKIYGMAICKKKNNYLQGGGCGGSSSSSSIFFSWCPFRKRKRFVKGRHGSCYNNYTLLGGGTSCTLLTG